MGQCQTNGIDKAGFSRRSFIKAGTFAGIGIITSNSVFGSNKYQVVDGLRVGIIGLDTSHATAFTKSFNEQNEALNLFGYKVVAAYPYGSKDIESSFSRIPGYIEEVRKMGVEIVDSISELLKKTDVILLETNDGRLHLEQALQVFQAGKTVFIDKPISASLADAYSIFQAAKDYKAPVFSSSSLRYDLALANILNYRNTDPVIGADIFGPCSLEPTHPDFFWYGIHGIESLMAIMGTGCQTVSRTHTPGTDVAVGLWADSRIGTYRGLRDGKSAFGGNVFCKRKVREWHSKSGYEPLIQVIAKFFQTGIPPFDPEETLEIFAIMEAADESKRRGGASVTLDEVKKTALSRMKKTW